MPTVRMKMWPQAGNSSGPEPASDPAPAASDPEPDPSVLGTVTLLFPSGKIKDKKTPSYKWSAVSKKDQRYVKDRSSSTVRKNKWSNKLEAALHRVTRQK